MVEPSWNQPSSSPLAKSALQAMQRDGWWWHDPALTNQSIRRRDLREALTQRF